STTKTVDVRSGMVTATIEREPIAEFPVYGAHVVVGWRARYRHTYLIRSAALSASRRAVSLNGLNRHSTAPFASTRLRIVLSPLAVMKTIGIVCRRLANSR